MRVLTYNIHHGEGRDGKFDLVRQAEIMKAAKPDVIALQEVDQGTERASGLAKISSFVNSGIEKAEAINFDFTLTSFFFSFLKTF